MLFYPKYVGEKTEYHSFSLHLSLTFLVGFDIPIRQRFQAKSKVQDKNIVNSSRLAGRPIHRLWDAIVLVERLGYSLGPFAWVETVIG